MTTTTSPSLVAPQATARARRDVVGILTLYVFFLMAIPSRYVFGPLGGAGAPTTLLGVAFLLLFVLRWLHPASSVGAGRQPFRLVGGLFLCAALASYISANLYKLGTLEENGVDRGLIIICGWLGIMLLTADGVGNMQRLDTLLRRMVFGATCMAVLGIIQFFTGLNVAKYIVVPGLTAHQAYTDIAVRGSFNRPSATAIHPLEFGFVLAVILPIAIHRAKYAQDKRLLRWGQVFLIALMLPMTVSRSSILGLAVILIVILPTWRLRERVMGIAVVVIGVAGIGVAIPGMLRSFGNLFSTIGSDSSTQSRTGAFSSAGPLIHAHPWFGMGFGVFMPDTYFFTDDQYLNTLIEMGFAGLVVVAALFITGWVLARQARRALINPERRHLAQCMAASAAVMLVGYGTFDALYFSMAAGVTFLMLGCIGAFWRLTTQRDPDLEPLVR
jgi:O-antigen ligase